MTAARAGRPRRAARHYSTPIGASVVDPVDTGHQRADAALNANHRDLLKGVDASTWPPESIDDWRALATHARKRLAEGGQLTGTDNRALDIDEHVRQLERRTRRRYRDLWADERARQTAKTTKERKTT